MGSDAGYGGYSEGTVSLSIGAKLYVNIGGKGLCSFEVSSDTRLGTSNGSGGYNGGGNSPYGGSQNNAGGGCTDIRYNSSSYDYQILVAGGGGGVDDCTNNYVNDVASGRRGRNLFFAGNDGSGGYGGGTVLMTDKTTWYGGYGFINGVIDPDEVDYGSSWDDERGWPEAAQYPFRYMFWRDGFGLPGTLTTGNARLLGGDVRNLSVNNGAGGGGYYGGTSGGHQESGGGGGSAYADIEGTILQVSNVRGYSDHETRTRTDSTARSVEVPLLNSEIPKVTYYGRPKDALTYGNGYVAIERQ